MKPIKHFLRDKGELLKNKANNAVDTLQNSTLFDKATRVYNYFKTKLAKIGNVFVAFLNGKPLPAITFPTLLLAFKNDKIKDKSVTFVGGRLSSNISGIKNNYEDVLKNIPSTLDYWKNLSKKLNNFKFESLVNEKLQLAHENSEMISVDNDKLQMFIKKAIENPTINLLIWGAPGIGKTAVVEQVIKNIKNESKKELNLITLQLSLKESDDFFLPGYELDDKGNKKASTDLPKSWLPVYKVTKDMTVEDIKAADEATGRGVIFLDELSQAKPSVQGTMLTFIQSRSLGEEYKLGSGWSIIAAANREQDMINMQDWNSALGNRFMQVNYEPTVKSWRKWAEKQNFISPVLLDWLEQNEEYFYFSAEDRTDIPFATPRSWTNACRILATFADTAEKEGINILDFEDSLIELIIAGNVGKSAARAFMTYIKLVRSIDINRLNEVFIKPKRAPLPEKSGKGYKPDLVYIYSTYIVSLLNTVPTQEQFDNLIKYIIRLNDERFVGRTLTSLTAKFGTENIAKLMYEGYDGTPSSLQTATLKDSIESLLNAYKELDRNELSL